MNGSKEDLQRTHDEQRLVCVNSEISRIKNKITFLKRDLKFKNQEKADIEYRLRNDSK